MGKDKDANIQNAKESPKYHLIFCSFIIFLCKIKLSLIYEFYFIFAICARFGTLQKYKIFSKKIHQIFL
nr:unnamed protein product [Callosobruchus chinensis]